jgi:hypothetical protein
MIISIYKKGIKFPPTPACFKGWYYEIMSLLLSLSGKGVSGPGFVNLSMSPGIDFYPGGIESLESIPGLLKRLSVSCKKFK